MSIRIIHFNQHGIHKGGVEGYIADIARGLLAFGHESGLACFEPEESDGLMPASEGFEISVSPKNWENALGKALADFRPDVAFVHAVYEPSVVRWLLERLPTVAYVHSPYLVCPGFAQYLRQSKGVCSRRSGIGCLVNAQTERCCFGRNPVGHVMRIRSVASFIDVYSNLPILVGSGFMRDLLIRNGISGENISVLAPVLFPRSTPTPAIAEDPNQILFSGRLVPEKGLDLLIDALTRVDRPWKLHVAGDGPERGRLEAIVQHNELLNRVNFLGWCSETEMADLYIQSAFVVVPSLWPEPFGRVGPEAAKYGRPAIAFDVGGIRDWLEEGVTGYVAPAKDVTALASCIQRLLDDPEHRHVLGQQSYELAMNRWNDLDHIHELIMHLRDAISRAS